MQARSPRYLSDRKDEIGVSRCAAAAQRSAMAPRPAFRPASLQVTGEHARLALLQARSMTLTEHDIASVLRGLNPTVLVPPSPGEDALAYGNRAASVLMVRYLLS